MALRPTSVVQIAKITFILVLVLLGAFLFFNNELNYSLKHMPNVLFKTINHTKKLQAQFPLATCNIGVKLQEYEYSDITKCVQGYAKLEKSNINSGKMEHQRVMIHKPYLTRNDSLMIEIGGYKGVDVDRLRSKGIRPKYIMLEPVPLFFDLLVKKFKKDDKITVLNFGLGCEDKILTIPIQTDATSLFRQEIQKGTETTEIKIRKSIDFFDEVGVTKKNVDLLHINCEGCEFELLEDLISTGYIKYFNHIQFQFHMHLPQIHKEECRYCQIMQLLRRTHTPMFQYRHTWQAWKKNDL
ncbi:hypothetical protein LOTGIDRAFT_236957 [Lottia gigantea]|uniref:Methyltransferase FkbM domain-containing protein n=1 Tax=Lottia gigantea TaxID=225164 RepID=V3YWP9_LOTGI|nr:hypothetical protein LOTGIDRAFT_236957 [Lottia gigantea]ESO82458.1 hypothetical protein LOTGIDRAFT_236957 [Lottia gigantea]